MNAAPDSSAPVPFEGICIFIPSHAFRTVQSSSSGAHCAWESSQVWPGWASKKVSPVRRGSGELRRTWKSPGGRDAPSVYDSCESNLEKMTPAGKACDGKGRVRTGEQRPPSSTVCRGASPNLDASVIYCKWLLVCAKATNAFSPVAPGSSEAEVGHKAKQNGLQL